MSKKMVFALLVLAVVLAAFQAYTQTMMLSGGGMNISGELVCLFGDCAGNDTGNT